jgi:uncharacterized protein (TIGR03546 family)
MLKMTGKPEDKKKKKPVSPAGVFWGIVLGSIAGCVPLLSILEGVLLFILLIFRTNIICTIVFFAAGKFLVMHYFSDFVDALGLFILAGNEAMVDFSRWFTGLPVITYLNFSNSMVMGGTALGSAAGLPLALIARHIALMFDRKERAKEKAEAEERAKLEKKNSPPAVTAKKKGTDRFRTNPSSSPFAKGGNR